MTLVMFGEGRKFPALGSAGAFSTLLDTKVGRVEIKRNGKIEVIKENVIETILPGQRVANMNPGGGGYGNPLERPIEKVLLDVKNGLVSIKGAQEDYGVVFNEEESI